MFDECSRRELNQPSIQRIRSRCLDYASAEPAVDWLVASAATTDGSDVSGRDGCTPKRVDHFTGWHDRSE